MTDRIRKMKEYFVSEKGHHTFRCEPEDIYALTETFAENDVPDTDRAVMRARYILDNETPVVFDDEKITLMRTIPFTPAVFTEDEMAELQKNFWVHESGDFNNFAPDYGMVLSKGFDTLLEEIDESLKLYADDEEKKTDLNAMKEMILSLSELCGRYQVKAELEGNSVVAGTLKKVPAHPAQSLLEALQFVRILNYGMWAANNYQCSLGRLDQTLHPYYKNDIGSGKITNDEALELIEEFFLSLNRDSDFYDGVQQGDNGQTLVIGGRNQDGRDAYNELSDIMLQACLELKLIDPKLNLRCDKNTPFERLVRCTELTKAGIGFPQYLNDDVIIPALLRWGYDPDDAYEYCAAACWEPIIPGCGTDLVNADGMNYPEAVLKVVRHIDDYPDAVLFENACYESVKEEARRMMDKYHNLYVIPSPMASFMMRGCIKEGRDCAKGCKYSNVGFHGVGISVAADSMEAVKELYYEKKTVSAERLKAGLKSDFADDIELKNMLLHTTKKMGNDEDGPDRYAGGLMSAFADELEGKKPDRGFCYRNGTASAMYYIWYGEKCPATPDGRRANEAFPANYSPSLCAHAKGPISVIKSFTKQDMIRSANGGPLTLEIHNSVFASDGNVEKVAELVKLFIVRGGHELQINAVNRDDMIDAQKHPERHKGMIVRVWGWSGYFVELEKEYQDQIIKRAEFCV
ncbi:MAG: pyruvate formate lyase family protein [Lachnospiraceae bacterium]|nr:pyruvate formate lyase family protein [Lachnospiraceae bacterium]